MTTTDVGNSKLSLGIDIGSTKAHAVVLDADSNLVAEAAMFTRRGPEGVLSCLIDLARRLSDKVGVSLRSFDAVGVGIPGVVNRASGEITSAVNLRIDHMPLGEMIAGEFAVPVRIDNDVKVSVVAAGMLLKSLSVTYLNFGTGLATATLAGRLIRGTDNLAGEIGHIVLDPQGQPCRCGQRGCLETIVGGAYLAPRMDMLDLDWTKLDQVTSATGKAARDQAIDVIARIAVLMATVYGSEHIILGGGVIQAAPWVLGAVKRYLLDRDGVAFPPYARIAEQIDTHERDDQLAAIGAALIGQGWTEGYKLSEHP